MTPSFEASVIPFYGGEKPHLFEIERRCMDRDGKVIEFLDHHLPAGVVLDIGAGNGYTAALLSNAERTVVALEPDTRMVDRQKPLVWAKGVAQDLPFHDGTFAGAYATWAFYFDGVPTLEIGLKEAHRVVKPGGPIIIVDNAGNDEFCALTSRNITSNRAWWLDRGFQETIIETSFRFDSVDEAQTLLSFYFGETVGRAVHKVEIAYRVAAYVTTARPE